MAAIKTFRRSGAARHAGEHRRLARWQPQVERLERRDLLAGLDGLNQPPVAVDDLLTTSQGVPLVFSVEDLLRNDRDPDGDALRVTLLAGSGPSHGTLQLLPEGRYVYLPAREFVGEDQFQYFAWDGTAFSAPATVLLQVVRPTRPPLAQPDFYSTSADTVLNVAPPGVLANDTDPDGRPLLAELVKGPAHGEVKLSPDGSFTYAPEAGFVGTDTFVYRARVANDVSTAASNDAVPPGGLAVVTIAVRPAQRGAIAVDDFFTTAQGSPLRVAPPGVLANDRGPAGVPLGAVLLTGPHNGKLELSPDGGFVYVPEASFSGVDRFTYRVVLATTTPPSATTGSTSLAATTVGVLAANLPAGTSTPPVSASGGAVPGNPGPGGSGPGDPTPPFAPDLDDVGVVTIYVRPALPGPIAQNDVYSMEQGQTLQVPAPGVLANDKPPPEHTLSASLLTPPAHGTVELRSDGSFVYVPPADFFGVDTFTYQALARPSSIVVPFGTSAGGANGEGAGSKSAAGGVIVPKPPPPLPLPMPPLPLPIDVATVTVYVRPSGIVVALPDRYVTKQDQPLEVPAPGVLANDRSPLDVLLSASLVSPPQHGTLSLAADGSFRYQPAEGFVGEDHFTYRASAGSSDGTSKGGGVNPGANGHHAALNPIAYSAHLSAAAPVPVPDPSIAVVTILVLGERLPPVVILPRHEATDESGPQFVPAFAAPTALSDPTQWQPPPLTLRTDRPDLFATPPTLDAAGRLVYAPAPNVQGQAVVDVMAASGTLSELVGQLTITITKPRPLYNVANPRDVNRDNVVSPLDALLVINFLNGGQGAGDVAPEASGGYFLDVSGDNAVSPIDALLVINYLNAMSTPSNAKAAEGKGALPPVVEPPAASLDPLLQLLAADVAAAGPRRRK